MYRLLKKVGLSHQTARACSYKTDKAEKQRWRDRFKKVADAEGYWLHYRGN